MLTKLAMALAVLGLFLGIGGFAVFLLAWATAREILRRRPPCS